MGKVWRGAQGNCVEVREEFTELKTLGSLLKTLAWGWITWKKYETFPEENNGAHQIMNKELLFVHPPPKKYRNQKIDKVEQWYGNCVV